MHVPLTLATLAIFTTAILGLRVRWIELSSRIKRLLLLFAVSSTLLAGLGFAGRLSTTSDRLNAAIYWCFILSYISFVLLYTRIRPTWLTSLVATVLLLPILSASALLPLTVMFGHQIHHIQRLGGGLNSDLVKIEAVTPGASGADLTIYRRIPWAPFLQIRYPGVRYFNTQCDTSVARAVLEPDHQSILLVCPPWPGLPPDTGREFLVSLHKR